MSKGSGGNAQRSYRNDEMKEQLLELHDVRLP
jgi:hypothetical protein